MYECVHRGHGGVVRQVCGYVALYPDAVQKVDYGHTGTVTQVDAGHPLQLLQLQYNVCIGCMYGVNTTIGIPHIDALIVIKDLLSTRTEHKKKHRLPVMWHALLAS